MARKEDILVSYPFEIFEDSFSSRKIHVCERGGELREKCDRVCKLRLCINNSLRHKSDYQLVDGWIVRVILKSSF